jgi:alkylation response protein AidB-like acyl-CoA dehydrogenase
MLKDSVARFVQEYYDLDGRNVVAAQAHGFSPAHWQRFASLGWLSLPFADEYDGLGGGAVDTMVIMQELGRGLVAEPFLATVLLFGGLIGTGGNEATKQKLIPKIISGELQGAFAWVERQSRYELTDIGVRAEKRGSEWVLNGDKTVVYNGGAAQKFVIAARTSGKQFDADGISLFLVDAKAPGLQRTTYRMLDGRESADIHLTNVSSSVVIGEIDQGLKTMMPVLDQALLAVCADALGAMEWLFAQTLEYLKTREQFGVPIGTFQVVQHRMVDVFAAIENTRSLLYRSVLTTDSNDRDAERSRLALKVMVGRAGRLVGGEAIQLHGGMGMTDELAVGFYVKRLMMANTLFGDADFHQGKMSMLVNRSAA